MFKSEKLLEVIPGEKHELNLHEIIKLLGNKLAAEDQRLDFLHHLTSFSICSEDDN